MPPQNAHVPMFLVHFRDAVELPLQVRVKEISRREWDGRLGSKHGFQNADCHSVDDGCLRRVFRMHWCNEVQLGVTLSVASLPSMSPLRVAVTGRQKL
jgi:hypothetical protein